MEVEGVDKVEVETAVSKLYFLASIEALFCVDKTFSSVFHVFFYLKKTWN